MIKVLILFISVILIGCSSTKESPPVQVITQQKFVEIQPDYSVLSRNCYRHVTQIRKQKNGKISQKDLVSDYIQLSILSNQCVESVEVFINNDKKLRQKVEK